MASTVEEVSEGAQKPYIPLIGRVELSLASLAALGAGAILWKMLDNSADTAADMLGRFIGNLVGFNPASGQSADDSPAYGGD